LAPLQGFSSGTSDVLSSDGGGGLLALACFVDLPDFAKVRITPWALMVVVVAMTANIEIFICLGLNVADERR
jgi:hypothetical protein